MRRIVSIHLPHWPVERLRQSRAGRTLPEAPLALVAESPRGILLHALNEPARLLGLGEGERLVDARARVPELVSQPADPAADAAALERLALWCGRYGAASNIEATLDEAGGDPRGIWIDISGVAHLFGGEAGLITDLARRLASFGLSARLGLASTHAAAFAMARQCLAASIEERIVRPRQERRALATLPIAGLDLEPATVLLLRRLGLKRIGDLYPLPRASLERRFPSAYAARAVLRRLDLALGLAPEALEPIRPPVRFLARRAFAEPLISTEGVGTAIAGLCAELCSELDAKGRGVRRLRLSAYRTDGSMLETAIGTSSPCNNAGHLLRLIEEKLDRIDAGFGLDAMALAVLRSEPMPAAQNVFAAARNAPLPPARLIDRLANRLGPANVCRPATRASHVPERAHAYVPILAEGVYEEERRGGAAGCTSHAGAGLIGSSTLERPHLLLPEPEPIEVIAEVPDGPPARFTWRCLPRRVLLAEGPERIAPEWWREIAQTPAARSRTRDYYRIEDEAGRRYWVFREGLHGRRGAEEDAGDGDDRVPRWFMHGLYG